MNSTEILDAVNARLLEKWPERRTYINVCPVNYERPSFWLEVTRDDRTPVTQRMTKRNVQIRSRCTMRPTSTMTSTGQGSTTMYRRA